MWGEACRFRMFYDMRVPSFTSKAVAAFVPHFATALQKGPACDREREEWLRWDMELFST